MQASLKHFSNILIKAVCTLILGLSSVSLQAQSLVVDATDRPIMPKEYTNLKGSPYLYDDWVKGEVRLANGVEYKDIFLMYDQVIDQLSFTYKKDKPQAFVDPVASFIIGDRAFRRDVMSQNKPLAEEFFEVLVDGEVKLLKRTNKKVLEEIALAVATKQKNIYTTTSYYLVVADKMVKVNNKKSVTKALGKHQNTVEKYIKEKDLNLKEEQDLVDLMTYYNTLD